MNKLDYLHKQLRIAEEKSKLAKEKFDFWSEQANSLNDSINNYDGEDDDEEDETARYIGQFIRIVVFKEDEFHPQTRYENYSIYMHCDKCEYVDIENIVFSGFSFQVNYNANNYRYVSIPNKIGVDSKILRIGSFLALKLDKQTFMDALRELTNYIVDYAEQLNVKV